jgi:phosphatidylglycerol:prolipoprotein diacylglycerol transferase
MQFDLDPVIFSLGPLQVRWYGLMYVIGFLNASFLYKVLVKEGIFHTTKERVDSLITHMLIGMFLGARTFYVFIYNWAEYSKDFLSIFYVWEGGLSYHGAIVGLMVGGYLWGRKNEVPFLQVIDCSAIVGAQGVFFGRLGNFINGELYGRVTDVPWGIVFPGGGPYPRHPSQLYEAFFEGVVLFALLWAFRKRFKVPGMAISLYFMGYAFMRFFIEFFRQPDSQLGYYFGGTITMGQILCFLMFLGGAALLTYCLKKKTTIEGGLKA